MDRYEEALEKARAGKSLEEIFPELKESEDERVRQGIIAVIQWAECFNASSVTHEAAEIMLAWLERQKDLDKMIVVSPEVWDGAMADAYENGKKDGEKQKEQKPAEWSEEDERKRQACISTINEVIDYERERWEDYNPGKPYRPIMKYDEQMDWLKSLRPPQYCENCKLKRSVENWKPSKNQMTMLLAVINDPYNAGAESCHLMLQSLYADLEKL